MNTEWINPVVLHVFNHSQFRYGGLNAQAAESASPTAVRVFSMRGRAKLANSGCFQAIQKDELSKLLQRNAGVFLGP